MKSLRSLITITSFSFVLLATTGCAMRAYQQRAVELSPELQLKAQRGELLTTAEWQMLLKSIADRSRTYEWLFGLIGRPDETVEGGPNRYYDFAIFKGKCLNELTGKPDDLCVAVGQGKIGDSVYDARKVRNL